MLVFDLHTIIYTLFTKLKFFPLTKLQQTIGKSVLLLHLNQLPGATSMNTKRKCCWFYTYMYHEYKCKGTLLFKDLGLTFLCNSTKLIKRKP